MKKSPLRTFINFKLWVLTIVFFSVSFFLPIVLGGGASAEIKTPPVPSTSIYVQDHAGVLRDDTKIKINQLGKEIATKSKAQLVVLTISSLEEQPLEEYSLAVLRKWQIGDRNLNNGVLLLIALNERKSRIEVGYGLEGALNDAKTGAIQDKYLIPFLAKGDYDQGIYNCYQALAGVVAKEYNFNLGNSGKDTLEPSTNNQEEDVPLWAQILVAVGILIFLFIDWFFLNGAITQLIISLLRSSGGGRGGGGSGGGGRYGGGSGGGGGSSRNW